MKYVYKTINLDRIKINSIFGVISALIATILFWPIFFNKAISIAGNIANNIVSTGDILKFSLRIFS